MTPLEAALLARVRALREVLEYIQDHTITYDFEKRIEAVLDADDIAEAEAQDNPPPPSREERSKGNG